MCRYSIETRSKNLTALLFSIFAARDPNMVSNQAWSNSLIQMTPRGKLSLALRKSILCMQADGNLIRIRPSKIPQRLGTLWPRGRVWVKISMQLTDSHFQYHGSLKCNYHPITAEKQPGAQMLCRRLQPRHKRNQKWTSSRKSRIRNSICLLTWLDFER